MLKVSTEGTILWGFLAKMGNQRTLLVIMITPTTVLAAVIIKVEVTITGIVMILALCKTRNLPLHKLEKRDQSR